MSSTRLVCRKCGSRDIITVGGMNGDPFDRSPDRLVCARCGSTVDFHMPNMESDVSNSAFKLRIHIFGRGERCTLSSTLDLPIEDGGHDLTRYDYPLSRYGEVEVSNLNICFEGVWYPIDKLPVTLQRKFEVESAFGDTASETHMITLSVELV
ncbi:MAG: hypothetical protein Q4A05_07210 [Ruminococcus sp.]|nr:hypothetical protein [Ruminococcus sp.]